MIIILPLLVGFGCLYWSSLLDTEHAILQLILQLIFLPFALISINISAAVISIDYASNATIVQALASFSLYLSWIMFAIGCYLAFTLMYRLYTMVKDVNLEHKRGMYE